MYELSERTIGNQAKAIRTAIGDQAFERSGVAAAESLRDEIDGAGKGAMLSLYADRDLAKCLVRLPLPYPCGKIDGAALTIGPIEDAVVEASGEARWAQIADGHGEPVLDGDAGTAGPHTSDATCPLILFDGDLAKGHWVACEKMKISFA